MNLAAYTATALSRNDITDTPTNKNIVDGAIVELKDLDGNLVVIYDDAAGANPETQKSCDSNGQLTFWAEVGDYALIVNGSISFITIGASVKFTQQSRQAIEAVYKAQGYNDVFFFEDGFTYTESNDVGIYEDGTAWTYAGTGTLPVTITAGTVPSESVYSRAKIKLPSFDSASDVEQAEYLTNLPSDTVVRWLGRFAPSDGGSNWGLLKFGAHTPVDGEVFSINANTYVKANLKGKSLNALKFGVDITGGSSSSAALQSGINKSTSNGVVFRIPAGQYLIDEPLVLQSGARVEGVAGRLTGSFKRTNLIAANGTQECVIDASNLKYGKISGVNVSGLGIGKKGIIGINLFGADFEDIRAEGFTEDGFYLENDNAGLGCYANTFKKCVATDCFNGFNLNSSGSNINLIVYDNCTATDCDTGFNETGTFGGRNIQHISPDVEKNRVGIVTRSSGFTIVGGYFEFNELDIEVKPANSSLAEGKSGNITGTTHLGTYNFEGMADAPSQVIDIYYFYDVKVSNIRMSNYKKGIKVDNNARNCSLEGIFVGQEVDEPFDIPSHTRLVKGSQTRAPSLLEVGQKDITIDPSIKKVCFDTGNFNSTLTLDITNKDYFEGFEHEVFTTLTTSNTGKVTISDSSGALFFGMVGNTRLSYMTSFEIGRGDKVIISARDNGQWLVSSSSSLTPSGWSGSFNDADGGVISVVNGVITGRV